MNDEIKKGRKKTKPSDISERYSSVFAKRLRDLIKEKGITQQELSDELGGIISRQTINKWTLGTTTPDIVSAATIADYFGVSTDYLLGRTETPSINEDVQVACTVTGLSEKAINKITAVKNHSVLKELVNSLVCSFDIEWLENVCKIRETRYIRRVLQSSCISAFMETKHPELNADDYDSIVNSEKYSKEYFKFSTEILSNISLQQKFFYPDEFEEFKDNKLFEELRERSIGAFDKSVFKYCKDYIDKSLALHLDNTKQNKYELGKDIFYAFYIESLRRCTVKGLIFDNCVQERVKEILKNELSKAGD